MIKIAGWTIIIALWTAFGFMVGAAIAMSM